jgi:UDP-3-O-[3-hydroxymyristoyl] glucosamine N-acyltransferase
VGERAKIGANTVLMAGVYIGDDSSVGEDTKIFPNVTAHERTQIGRRVRIHAGAVIGSDGFGYVFDAGIHRKVPQTGNVVIHDDVEIGSNTSVDRAALGSTVIGKGTKIDNLVQVAHNVVIGEHCLLCAQTGIAGSVTLGKYVVLAGQVGVSGHLKIGNKVTVASQSGVLRDIPDGGNWFGYPAQPHMQAKRCIIAVQHLPETLKQIAQRQQPPGGE